MRVPSHFGLFALAALAIAGCSLFYTRPVQEMSDTSAALRAAREVQADTLSPELYRQGTEWFFRARKEYKLKNFKVAAEYADKARTFAEQAEFDAIRNGGNRTEEAAPDPTTPGGARYKPYAYPSPQGTPVESYEDRRQKEEAERAKNPGNAPAPAPSSLQPAVPLQAPPPLK